MLYITQGKKETRWHVGEPLPTITSPVIEFQADGHELLVILNALRQAPKKETSTEKSLDKVTLDLDTVISQLRERADIRLKMGGVFVRESLALNEFAAELEINNRFKKEDT